MYLYASLLLFMLFFGNVFWASRGAVSLFTDVQELLLLMSSVFLFVAGILRAEQSQSRLKQPDSREDERHE